jgi:dsDNA-specific endonuclease/ATPase MutS2
MAIELTEKFIGFVDIMGFKSLMARAEVNAGLSHDELFEIAKLLGTEKDRADRIKHGSKICPHAPYLDRDVDFHVTQQFDCAVISTEISPAGVVNLIWHCATACLNLLGKGVMCRGLHQAWLHLPH